MPLNGVLLSVFKSKLSRIPDGVLPTRTIERFEERLLPYVEELEWKARQYADGSFDPAQHCHALPLEFYAGCTFEELAKIWATHFIMMPREINQLFEQDGDEHYLIEKIRISLNRWGSGSSEKEWNTLVEAYNGIKNFSFGLPEFTTTLAYPYYRWSRGITPSDTEVFIDGGFGFFVHYHGVHVMTIGFSIAHGGRLLLSQVQLRKPKGNRFLYKLPEDRLVYVISLMRKYFPRLTLYLVDGASLTERYIHGHEVAITEVKAMRNPDRECLQKNETKLALLKSELGTYLRALYRPVSDKKWRVSTYRPVEVNKIRFHRVVNY